MIDTIIDFLLTGINYCFDVFSRFITAGLEDMYLSVFSIAMIVSFLIMPIMSGTFPNIGSGGKSDKAKKYNSTNNTKSSSKKNNKGN